MNLNKRHLLFFIILQVLPNSSNFASQYYVSTTGSDSNPGTIDSSFATIAKAISVMQAGDTTYVRGGVYVLSTNISISKIGRSNLKYHLFGYPNERPLLDFSSQIFGTRGLSLSGYYWYIKGIDIKGAGDNGLFISGSNNLIEFCTFVENRDSGLQLSNGASNNRIINCDSYYNADPIDYGDADGFACKMDVGTGNSFYGCRAWWNVDDGWDGYLRGADDVTTIVENCWTWRNGYLKDGTNPGAQANGNGFKTGGCDVNTSGYKTLKHNMILKNCLAFYNKDKGFDQNSNRGLLTFINCTGYGNGTHNFAVPDTLAISAGKVLTVINCVSLGSPGGITLRNPILSTNSWPDTPPYLTTATNADFVSIDTTGISGLRKSDGSLPDITFMHLAPGSQFINSGTDVGLPFNESKPDLGCFETGVPAINIAQHSVTRITDFQLLQNYPNPFNPNTVISYQLPVASFIKLTLYTMLGQEIRLIDAGIKEAGKHNITFIASGLASGVYFYRLNVRYQSTTNMDSGFSEMKKMILLK